MARCISLNISPAELSVCDGAASFLQSGFWGSFKARFGWEPSPFLVNWGTGPARPLLVIRRPLGPGLSFAYVPWGPELPEDCSAGDAGPDAGDAADGGGAENSWLAEKRRNALETLACSLKPLLPGNTAFIRFDPPWYSVGAGTAPPAPDKPFVRAAADVQPPDTVIIDLAKDEDALLMEMKPKWRYNIRLAERKGLLIQRLDEQGLEVFYALFEETARRDGIAVHSLDYYRALFELCRTYPGGGQEARLYLASHNGDPAAAIITLFRGDEAVYLYGASSDRNRNLMAPYLLQWRAMNDAKAAGCRFYDLFGIPPGEDPGHPMAGLYRFKTGFGGRIIHRPGSWDLAYRPLATGLFRAAESLRKSLMNAKKNSKHRFRNRDNPHVKI
ncbi:MAG: peptidoglycan bridge formation glycyltransferase FemA/FemB family protein [Treponema sp.]|jgi:lipid II:glycine glycyltransferase (peptidoglycan interpeptide bridge formation enzyme)|nr:peptidoglycan bridge formation glycyltransferase FemA/FemB family protein [Treponema sp.]